MEGSPDQLHEPATAEQAAEQIDLLREQNTLLKTLAAQPPVALGSPDRDK